MMWFQAGYSEFSRERKRRNWNWILRSSPSHHNSKKEVPPHCAIIAFTSNSGPFRGIPGDGRCLFRSVVHGVWLREGRQSSNESLQKQLADELRDKVVDEFIKRRKDTEWFVEGDFDRYVAEMRRPHTWGGEPELLMCSHVLELPITVYMLEKNSGRLRIIAEYGGQYGKENPVRVLYHGYGHYDVLQRPISTAPSKYRSIKVVES